MASALSAPPHRFLSFDVGTRRTGVASGNTMVGRGAALATLEASGEALLTKIDALVAEWQPDALVVGVPFHPDGQAHVNTARARRFARALSARYGLEVHEVDERYSTVEAAREAPGPAASRRRAQGKADVDARAAAVILDQFLGGLR